MGKIFKKNEGKKFVSFLVVLAMLFTMTTQLVLAKDSTNTSYLNSKMNTLSSTEKTSKDKVVDVLIFNDFHGNLAEDVREKGKNIGMAKMVGYVKEAIRKNPNTIVVSGGDN